jgi:hypothetical protein
MGAPSDLVAQMQTVASTNTAQKFRKAIVHVSRDTVLSNFELADAIARYSDGGEIRLDRFVEFVLERGYRPYFADAWNGLDLLKILVHSQAVWLLTSAINVPSSAFDQLINATSTGWEMDVDLWGPYDNQPPLLIIEQLKHLVNSISTMQYTCSFLLILQALTFLRIAKGYERLGIVTQTMAYAQSELIHFTMIFFFIREYQFGMSE